MIQLDATTILNRNVQPSGETLAFRAEPDTPAFFEQLGEQLNAPPPPSRKPTDQESTGRDTAQEPRGASPSNERTDRTTTQAEWTDSADRATGDTSQARDTAESADANAAERDGSETGGTDDSNAAQPDTDAQTNESADSDASNTPNQVGAQVQANASANAAASAQVATAPRPGTLTGENAAKPIATSASTPSLTTVDANATAVNSPNGTSASGDGEANAETDSSKTGQQPAKAETTANARATSQAGPASGFSAVANAQLDAGSSTSNPLQNASTSNAGPTTGPNAPAPAGSTDALNEARLARGLKSALNQQGGSVTLRLTPPEMGTVRIQMQIQGTQVAAQFHAETDAARSLLQQQLGSLRTALEGQGLSVDRLGVQSMTGGSASNFNGSSTQHQNQSFGQSQDPNANGDGRSRGSFQQAQDESGRSNTPGSHDTNDSFAELFDAEPLLTA